MCYSSNLRIDIIKCMTFDVETRKRVLCLRFVIVHPVTWWAAHR